MNMKTVSVRKIKTQFSLLRLKFFSIGCIFSQSDLSLNKLNWMSSHCSMILFFFLGHVIAECWAIGSWINWWLSIDHGCTHFNLLWKRENLFFFVESIIGAHFIVVYMCNFQLQMSAYQISMEIYLKLVKG